jgi:hypothetical protein
MGTKRKCNNAPYQELENADCSPPVLLGVINMGLHPVVPDMFCLLVVSVVSSYLWCVLVQEQYGKRLLSNKYYRVNLVESLVHKRMTSSGRIAEG